MLLPIALLAFLITLGAIQLFSSAGSSKVGIWHNKIADNAPIGTCITTKQAWDGDKSAVTSVPCDQPHWGEILGYPLLAAGPSPYPGDEQSSALAEFRCGLMFAGRGLDGRYAYTKLHPGPRSWNDGSNDSENYATCAVFARDNLPLTGQLVRADQPIRTDVSVPMNISSAPIGVCVATNDGVGKSLPEWPIIDCEHQHWGEVLARPVLYPASAPWPGDAAVITAADAACRSQFSGRLLPPQYTYTSVYPSRDWWSPPPAAGIPASCLTYRTDNQQFTGPAR